MAFFSHRTWQIIEKLEIYTGLWPYQSRLKNSVIRFISVLLMITTVTSLVIRLIKELGVNLHIVTEIIISIQMVVGVLFKLSTACVYEKALRNIYGKVDHHFRTMTKPEEAFMLAKFSENGMKFCLKYIFIHTVYGMIFFGLPAAKMLIEASINNREFQKIIPYYGDYGPIDQDKYYVLILLHFFVTAAAFILTNLAVDLAFIMYARHACALFEIVKIRLEEASGFFDELEWGMLDERTADNEAYESMKRAIDLHIEALEIVLKIEKVSNFSLLVTILEGIFLFSGGVHMVLSSLNNPFELLRYFTAFNGLLFHFVIPFMHGQMIIDVSSSVFATCYNVRWFIASKKTKTLLSIMMSRSSRPSFLTGGGFFIISLETLGKMVKVGFSYFSVFYR